MARKQARVIVVLQGPDGQQTYTTIKNKRNEDAKNRRKLVLRKYSPTLRKHVEYTEVRVRKGK